VFAQPLDVYGKWRKSFTECEKRREIKGQIGVVWRLVFFGFVRCVEKGRQASSVANDSQDPIMTKLRQQPMISNTDARRGG